MTRRLIALLAAPALVAVAAGCGGGTARGTVWSKPAPVAGRITLADGTPLRGGVVSFLPVEPSGGGKTRYPGEALVNAKGEYTGGMGGSGNGLVPGEYRVAVRPRELNEVKNSNVARIPRPYRDAATTPLRVTVAEADNTIDIVLK
jgi:hypothetical protein